MTYFDLTYLFVFLPIVVILYRVLPAKVRWLVLLGASIYFYQTLSGNLFLWVIGAAVWTWDFGLLIAQSRRKIKAKEKIRLTPELLRNLAIAGLLASLLVLKYKGFVQLNIGRIRHVFDPDYQITWTNFMVPIGISFYTLDAIGYLVDICWEKQEPIRNPLKMLLYLSFFPKIMEGPILSNGQLTDTLFAGKTPERSMLSHGLCRIQWGFFKELVVANRLIVPVNQIFDNYRDYSGAAAMLSGILYAVQLYMDFSGTMDVVLGTAELFGITLPENFAQPFFAKDAAEFWRRWHISLGVWFRTYIFYPVSLSGPVMKWNKAARKKYGLYIMKLGTTAMCLFPVWLANGIWHGAQWSYIFYGMYYFVILFLETAVLPTRKKLEKKAKKSGHLKQLHLLQILKTWLIIFIGEMFFRAPGLKAGFYMFRSMFGRFNAGALMSGGKFMGVITPREFLLACMGVAVVFVYDCLKENGKTDLGKSEERRIAVQWTLTIVLFLIVIVCGAYGEGYQKVDMIYAGF